MKKKKVVKAIIIFIWAAFFAFFLGVSGIILMVKYDTFGWFGGLPSLKALERPDPDLSSELISSDGVSLGKYFRKNRSQVTYYELSPDLINTLLVTEDIRFKEHAGIDLKGLIRAIFGQLTGQFKGGGSTITMQLAENLYRTSSENRGSLYAVSGLGQVITKLKEWIISIQLEESYTKEEILAMYLNTVEFGSNSYGIKVAAKTFFNKLPAQLTYLESAVLIGSINAPTRYNPVYNPENAMNKRTEILHNLYKYDIFDRKAFDSLKIQPFGLNYKVDSHTQGLATYFRSVIRDFLLSWTKENGYDLFEDGLRIHTTIDSRMQGYAERALAEHMDTLQSVFINHLNGDLPWIDEEGKEIKDFIKNEIKRTSQYRSLIKKFPEDNDSLEFYLRKKKPMTVFSWEGEIDTLFSAYDSLEYYKHFLQAGFMAMEPKTGHIKAWVGGIDYKYFKYDHVKQGKRQPGSVIKPIVYTAAIDNGYSPCFPVIDAAVTFAMPGQDPPTWTPDNADGKFSGAKMTIRQAMARSVNSATAFIMSKVGPRTVVDYAKRLGVKSTLSPVPSLSLGAGGDVSLFEILGAYSTFVNQGNYTEPFYITRIEDKNGNIIQQFVPEIKEALNEETAYLMLHMLKGTTEEPGGTGVGLDPFLKQNNDIGGKTGTTQNGSDGWFVGITKELVAGAWVGGDNRSIHFKNWAMGQGARTAMPIFEKFMLKIYKDRALKYEKGAFDEPINPISVKLDCNFYDQDDNSDLRKTVEEDDFF